MNDLEMGHWLAARAGKLTASRMADAMSYKKDGTPMKERADYMRDLLAERLTGLSVRHYVTDAMQHGLDFEIDAKRAYEAHTGILLAEGGFFEHPMIENFGGTPDALVELDGLVETKCPTSGTFLEWVLKGCVPEKHKPQMIAQCAVTGRAWVDFVAYDPRIRETCKRLFIRRYVPSADEITKVEDAATKFLEELELLWEAFVTAPMEAHEPHTAPARSDGPNRVGTLEQANS